MLNFQPWKTWTVLIICLLGVVLAAPNALPTSMLDQMPKWLPLHRVNLGLDLQGGSHLLYEVDMSEVAKERLTSTVDAIRPELAKRSIGYTDVSVQGDHIVISLRDPGDRDKIVPMLPLIDHGLEIRPDTASNAVVIGFTEKALLDRRRAILEQSVEMIRKRIDTLGTKEPTILREGDDRVLVQLPGVDDPERVKEIIGKTAKMTFRMVDTTASLEDARRGKLPTGDEYLLYDASNGRAGGVVVNKRVLVDGANLTDAQLGFRDNQPVITFKFDSVGTRRFGDATRANVGKPFAIILDNKVLSDPVIREPITGGSGEISGSYTAQSASDLALLLRGGALPAPLKIIEERTVGPDLGADSIRAGTYASILAMILVSLFMVAFYGLFGLYADLALVFNLAILLGALSLIGATLTLPGIAGMALTMGMAVDANVLVNERIREEVRAGRGVISAVDNGFSKAYATITDANVTHFIAGAFLFILGSGPVKGFAVTLCVGIGTSLFTTMMVTRLFVVWWLRTRPKALPI